MAIEYDALAYEMPWRPNYEKRAVMGWGWPPLEQCVCSRSQRCPRSLSTGWLV